MSKLVSIIIPCYNGADFIEKTIQSVLDQTYKQLEVIVVDDGSMDHSKHVIKNFKDPRIQYVYQENQGLSAARNTGLRCAKGMYISFLDADDLFLPTKIEYQVHFLEHNSEFGLVAQGFIRTDERGKYLYRSIEKEKEVRLEALILRSQFPVHTTLIRREWTEKVGLFDTSLKAAEDWDYYCRLSLLGCRMYKQAVAECTYRLLDNAMTTNAPRQTEMLLRVVEKTFSHPNLPFSSQKFYCEAKFNINQMGACRCWALNYFEAGAKYLDAAVRIDAQRVRAANYESLVETIAFFCKHMQVRDSEEKAINIVKNCSEQFPFLEKIQTKMDFHIGLSKQKKKLRYMIKNILTKPFSTIRIIIDLIVFRF